MRIAGVRASGLYYLNLYEEIVFMSELHLNSLEITNFRCFEHLTIEKLGRVNLIVGKNSVGKTALLEGLWLFSCDADWIIMQKMLYDRNELVRYKPEDSRDEQNADYLEKQEQLEAIKSLFYGRPPKNIKLTHFYSGTSPISDGRLSRDGFSFKIASSEYSISLAMWHGNDHDLYLHRKNPHIDALIDAMDEKPINSPSEPVYEPIFVPPLPKQISLEYSVIGKSKDYNTVFVPLSGLTWKATCTYWDDLTLTDREDEIVSRLQIIEPSIKKANFKGENSQNRIRYPVIKSERFESPLPLANMGEGIQRVFAIALAMSTASRGYLLIDEFETGLHYSVQADVWRAVFKLAHEWNVQVFATTHSWDCIEAFQEAAAEDHNEEAMLISLQQRKAGIKAVLFDEDDLKIVTRGHIEVR